MDTQELMLRIDASEKYIFSNKKPQVIGDCPWMDIYFVRFLSGKSVIAVDQKELLRNLEPLVLPLTTVSWKCPIEGKQIAFALHYFQIGNWTINSVTRHYICVHNIFVPDSLVDAILAL